MLRSFPDSGKTEKIHEAITAMLIEQDLIVAHNLALNERKKFIRVFFERLWRADHKGDTLRQLEPTNQKKARGTCRGPLIHQLTAAD